MPELHQYWDALHSAQQQGRLTPVATVASPSSPELVNRLGDREQRKCLDAAWAWANPLGGKRVLDLGCGTGRWLKYLQAGGAEVVGIDWSFQAVCSVHRLLGVPAIQMSISLLSFQQGAFDAVNCVTVLQHVPPETQRRAFAEVHRILKPGGWFCLLEACSTSAAAPHMFPRSQKEWATLAQDTGFEVVASIGSFFGVLLRRYVYFRHWIRTRVGGDSCGSTASAAPAAIPPRSLLTLLQSPWLAALALLCYPLGRLLRFVPGVQPLHCAFVLRRPLAPEEKLLEKHHTGT